MRRGWVRTSLVVAMLGVAAASGYQLFFFEQLIDKEREAERSFSALGWELTASISELRASQQAYVAAGQDPSHWMQQFTEQLDTVDIRLVTLAQRATAAATIGSLENVKVAINDLSQMDRRARNHSEVGQDLMASDLLFTDGPELALVAISHVALALETEREASDTTRNAHRKSQGVALATAMGTSVLVALLLLPSSGRPTAKNVALTDGTEEESDGVSLQEIEESSAKTDQEDIDGVLLQDKTATPTDVSATLDLQLAADLRPDLGQLSNTSNSPQNA